MNGGNQARCDIRSLPGQFRQLVLIAFGSCQIGSNARKAKAGCATFQSVQKFVAACRRLRGKISEGGSQLFAKPHQALFTQQSEQLGNTLLIDVLHGRSPR